MIPIFTMILWSKAHKYEKGEMVNICYQLLSELKNYGSELSPNYILKKSEKNNTEKFEFDFEVIEKLIQENKNKEKGIVFNNLGSNLSFFSSFDEKRSSSINIRIGVESEDLYNTLVVRLPISSFSGFDLRKKEFEDLFKALITLFKPFYAFIANSLNNQISEHYWQDDKPTYVHWMNFYDYLTAKKLDMSKLLALKECEKLCNGYFLKLQSEPLDINKNEHLSKQRAFSELLGLIRK